MISHILTTLRDVSLSKTRGKFLADKSYAFDTIFFIAKFLLHNQCNLRFNKRNLREDAIAYIEDIFQLQRGTSGAVNYYLESINLLEFANILTKETENDYLISDKLSLHYIAEFPEHAYIFLYLLTWQTFENHNLLNLFTQLCHTPDISSKERIIQQIYHIFCQVSISIQSADSNWSKQLVKYSLIVLGFANYQLKVSRTLKVKNEPLTIEDISLNVAGTRTPLYLPKKNDYLKHFNRPYVEHILRPYLVVSPSIVEENNSTPFDSIAQNLADLKLSLLDKKTQQMPEEEKEQYIKNIVRTRNQAIQRQFRKNLLDNNEHKCPLCGFCFEDFLIASHIKPYAKCDHTYDAINHYNGFLLCPNHDKLFESAKYMTIHYATGQVFLSNKAANSIDYRNLVGFVLPKVYIQNERRHYLEWHNKAFIKHNPTFHLE